jgi:hypothetical protein
VAEKISGTMKAARQGILQMNTEGAKAQLDK